MKVSKNLLGLVLLFAVAQAAVIVDPEASEHHSKATTRRLCKKKTHRPTAATTHEPSQSADTTQAPPAVVTEAVVTEIPSVATVDETPEVTSTPSAITNAPSEETPTTTESGDANSILKTKTTHHDGRHASPITLTSTASSVPTIEPTENPSGATPAPLDSLVPTKVPAEGTPATTDSTLNTEEPTEATTVPADNSTTVPTKKDCINVDLVWTGPPGTEPADVPFNIVPDEIRDSLCEPPPPPELLTDSEEEDSSAKGDPSYWKVVIQPSKEPSAAQQSADNALALFTPDEINGVRERSLSQGSDKPARICFDENPHCGNLASFLSCSNNIDVLQSCSGSCRSCLPEFTLSKASELKKDRSVGEQEQCEDENTKCPKWANQGWCNKTSTGVYLHWKCLKSCNLCGKY